MSGTLYLRNRQRGRKIDTRFFRRTIRSLLEEDLEIQAFELGIFLVGEASIARLNREHLGHEGATDVITFDYSDASSPDWLGGDIFVCVPVAIQQAARFRVPWQQELARYVVHGILHLRGHDDHDPVARGRMKKEENRLVRRLSRRVRLEKISEERVARDRKH